MKLRDGLMDIKHLEDVDRDGLELWRPVMKSPLPVSAADARAVLAALGVPAPALEREAYELADLVAAEPVRCDGSTSTSGDGTSHSTTAWRS